MTDRVADISQRKAARIAGIGYLIIFITAFFAEFFIRQSLIVPGDAVTTVNNILANELLFRGSIVGWLIALIFDVVVALALYVLLKPVNKSIALLAAWFRLIHAAVAGINLLNGFFALQLLGGAEYFSAFEANQLHALVMPFLNAHSYGLSIGIAFFAVHLLILGYLVFKAGYLPRITGILLIIASLFYILDNLAYFLMSNYATPMFLALLIVVAESVFFLWLLFKGGKIPEMKS